MKSFDVHPVNGCIIVRASSLEQAKEKIREALVAHPDIDPDWFEVKDCNSEEVA